MFGMQQKTADHRVYAEHIGGDAKLLCRGSLKDCYTYIESMKARVKRKEIPPLGAGWSIRIMSVVDEIAQAQFRYEVAGAPLVAKEDAARLSEVMAAIDLNHPLVAAIAREKKLGKVRALHRVRKKLIEYMAAGRTLDEAMDMMRGDNVCGDA